MRLGVVVNYCSIDSFLWSRMSQMLAKIADEVVVVRRTHLFGGDAEPHEELGFPTLTLSQFDGSAFDACVAMRQCGVAALPSSIDTVLLLDSDELCECERLHPWLHDAHHTPVYLPAEWYWRQPTIATLQQKEVAGLLCPKDKLVFGRKGDREMMAEHIARPRLRGRQPMHHFSWCKPFPDMIRKVRNWGHRDDRRDWETMVRNEWQSPLPGTCFVHRNRPLVLCDNLFQLNVA